MRTFFADAETDEGVKITVEYYYDRFDGVTIESAQRREDGAPVELTDSEGERIETWINEHRYFDDHAE